jgi:hypothetical protein
MALLFSLSSLHSCSKNLDVEKSARETIMANMNTIRLTRTTCVVAVAGISAHAAILILAAHAATP